jgi:hypothetical protein
MLTVQGNVNPNPENLATIDQDIFEATRKSLTLPREEVCDTRLSQTEIFTDTNTTGFGSHFHGFSRWTLTDTPMWLDFAEPTLLNLDNTSFLNNKDIALVDYNYHKGFVYIILAANITKNLDPHRWPDFAANISHPVSPSA